MVGKLTVTKPSRSDEILDAENRLRIANQIRAQFDALEPKRPMKPNRSEPESESLLHPSVSVCDIPELRKFQSLQSHSHAIISSAGVADPQDDFVETQYYKELASIGKQHHTTGTGFIKAVREGGEGGYKIQLPNDLVNNVAETRPRCHKSNPATNDWVPNSDEYQEMGCGATTVV